MASSFYYSAFLLLSLLSLLHQPVLSVSRLHTKSRLFPSQSSLDQISTQEIITTPSTLFEVTKPIKLPKTQPCSYQLLQHDFGFTYGSPPVLAPVSPPSPSNGCPSQNFDKIVLELTATSKGVQFDRIFGVWIGGVDVLRSSTAEPSVNGIVWTVEKDITRCYNTDFLVGENVSGLKAEISKEKVVQGSEDMLQKPRIRASAEVLDSMFVSGPRHRLHSCYTNCFWCIWCQPCPTNCL